MSDSFREPPSRLSRLLQNPVSLRRRSRIVAVGVALVSGVAGSGVIASGAIAGALTAIVWLLVPIVAAGIGMGDAFFLRHGIGERRVAWSAVLGVVVAISGCAVLAAISASAGDVSVLAGVLYFALVGGVILVLASGIAIAAGRATGYLSRRIQDADDTNW